MLFVCSKTSVRSSRFRTNITTENAYVFDGKRDISGIVPGENRTWLSRKNTNWVNDPTAEEPRDCSAVARSVSVYVAV